MYASIDEVVDKLGAQLRKLKERRANHKFGDQPRVRELVRRVPTQEPSEIEVVRPTLQAMTVEDAMAALHASQETVFMFMNAASGNVQVLQRFPNGKVSLIDPAPGRARASHGRA
jgi:putative sigma-54 modulation protein